MSQILKGRGVSAQFDSSGVRIQRSRHRVDIPLPAIREVRAVEARTVEIVLTDGTSQRVEGGNPTAGTAFVTALTALLPEERDPLGRAVVTDTAPEHSRRFYGLTALAVLLVLAYLGYAVWVALTHGTRVLGVVVGVLPFACGVLMLVEAVLESYLRILMGRRGITVRAEAVGTQGKKKAVYDYAVADGTVHTYVCKRKRKHIDLAYDPHRPTRAVHADRLPFVLARVVLRTVGACFWLYIGVVMVLGVLW